MRNLYNVIETYEPTPMCGEKSFYGKCFVKVYKDGTKVLQSYNTDVIRRNSNGTITRLWEGWSMTTGRHIYAFVPIRKKQWDKMEIGKDYDVMDL